MSFNCGSCEVRHQINELWYVFATDKIINLDIFLKETEGNFEVESDKVFCYLCLGAHYPDAGLTLPNPLPREDEQEHSKRLYETMTHLPEAKSLMMPGSSVSKPSNDTSEASPESVSSGTASPNTHMDTMNMMMDMFKKMQEQMDGLKHLGKYSVNKEIETEVTNVPKEPIFTSSTGITKEMATNSGGKTFNIL